MHWLDWIVIGLYFLTLLGVAWWVIAQRKDTSSDYFLAGRNVGWFVIGASLFASNIGSEHLVGLAGTGAKSGMAMAHYELHAWCLLVLGWVLVPFYSRSLVFTTPEFLERRYTPAARWFLSLVSLIAYVFTKVSVTLAAGGIVVKTLFPTDFVPGLSNFWLGALILVIVTGLYTVAGGLRAVVYTEVVQTIVLVLGSVLVTSIGLYYLGGWTELKAALPAEHLDLWKPMNDPDFPWLGMLIGAPIVGLWYWCTDQYIVQRTLAARNQALARRGTIFGAYLKLSAPFLFIIPGMIAFALATNPGPWNEKFRTLLEGNTDQAYAMLVLHLLPDGVRGLVVGGLLAALMSSLSSVFNSSSTLFTIDIYKKLRPEASEHTLVWVGRMATAVMVGLGLAWIPFMQYVSGALYQYLQAVQAYIAPPIFAVFFLGVIWKRTNATGCMVGLVGGFVLGMARLVAEVGMKIIKRVDADGIETGLVDWPWLTALYAEGSPLTAFASLNFLYFCIVLFAVAIAGIVIASLATAPPPPEKLRGLTFGTLSDEDQRLDRASWNRWDVIHTCVILLIILSVYLYFSKIGLYVFGA